LENAIRRKVNLLKEDTDVSANIPTRSTGINVLANTLKQIIPIIKQSYELLTTNEEQKTSFRSHVIQNAINTLMRVDITTSSKETEGQEPPEKPEMPTLGPEEGGSAGELAVEEPAMEEPAMEEPEQLQEADLEVDVEDQPPGKPVGGKSDEKFIPIDDKAAQAHQEKVKPAKAAAGKDSEFVQIQGLDRTGMEMAQRTFPKIQKQLGDSYAMLSNVQDKEEFADYLVANLKLYFDQFDQEMQPNIPEPESAAYDQIKQKADRLGGQIQENLIFSKIYKTLTG